MAPSPADRDVLDAVAAGLSARWRYRRGRAELLADGISAPVQVQRLRRSVALCALPPPALRFDRVVLRVCRDLSEAATPRMPTGTLGFVTIQAPIRQASKTVMAIEHQLVRLTRRAPTGRLKTLTLLGNRVRVSSMPAPRAAASRLVCLVHTADKDAVRLGSMTRDLLATAAQAAAPKVWRVIVTKERGTVLPAYRHLFSQLRLPGRAVMLFGDGKTGRLD